MLSISRTRATIVVVTLVLLAGCRSALPWSRENPRDEANMAFILDGNLVRLQTTMVNGRTGRHIFSSALTRSVLDTRLAADIGPADRDGYLVTIGEKQTRNIRPVVADLGPVGDAIIGADIIGGRAVTIDYASGLVTWQRRGIFPGMMTLYSFNGPPQVTVTVNGQDIRAVVDTASPDSLVMPGAPGRGQVSVSVAGADFGLVDVRTDPAVSETRIGNRLLANFVVSIDYGKRVVGLFHDPRTDLAVLARPDVEREVSKPN